MTLLLPEIDRSVLNPLIVPVVIPKLPEIAPGV